MWGWGNRGRRNGEESGPRVESEFHRQSGNVRTSEFKGQKYALDTVGYQDEVVGLFSEQHPLDALYLPAIDVARHGYGLALQEVSALRLIAPFTELNVHGAENPQITFQWEVDTDLSQIDKYETQLFVSALRPGQGLRSEEHTS